jgi:hypothetical protein
MSSDHPFAAAWRDPEFRAKQIASIREGLKRRQAAGLQVGRPAGSKNKPKKVAVEQKEPV